MFGSFAESLITSILWWRMSQAGTQVDISTKFHTIVKLEKMLKSKPLREDKTPIYETQSI